MPDLREQLQQCLRGRVCLVGLGNVDFGDDGTGVRLVEALITDRRFSHGNIQRPTSNTQHLMSPERQVAGCSMLNVGCWTFSSSDPEAGRPFSAVVGGTTPERFLSYIAAEGFDHVIFLDAVEFGGRPGSVVLLSAAEIAARFPQVSTHRLSLGLLARQVEGNGISRVWLLGVHPESLRQGESLSPTVQRTLSLLVELFNDCSSRGNQGPELSRVASAATKEKVLA